MSPTRWFARSHGLTPSEQFSDSDLDANALALGLMQIRTLPSGAWNDPTARTSAAADSRCWWISGASARAASG